MTQPPVVMEFFRRAAVQGDKIGGTRWRVASTSEARAVGAPKAPRTASCLLRSAPTARCAAVCRAGGDAGDVRVRARRSVRVGV